MINTMHRQFGKYSNIPLMVFLILALMGSYILSTNESFYVENINTEKLSAGSCFTITNHSVDWIAEDITAIGKAQGNLSSSMHSGILRIFILAGISVAAIYFFGLHFNLVKSSRIFYLKNTIHLNLRI